MDTRAHTHTRSHARDRAQVIQRALVRMRAIRVRRTRPGAIRTIMTWLTEQHKNKAVRTHSVLEC